MTKRRMGRAGRIVLAAGTWSLGSLDLSIRVVNAHSAAPVPVQDGASTDTITFSVGGDGAIYSNGQKIDDTAQAGSLLTDSPHQKLGTKVIHEDAGVTADNINNAGTTGENVGWYEWIKSMYPKKKDGKKKTPFLNAVPYLFKFMMYWWCAILLVIMSIVILDFCWLRYVTGGKDKEWLATYSFFMPQSLMKEAATENPENPKEAATDRARFTAEIWRLLTDIPSWDEETHPSLVMSEIVGKKEKLAEGVIMRVRPKQADLTEEEKRGATVERKCVAIEDKKEFAMETLNEMASFTHIYRTKVRIQLDEVFTQEAERELADGGDTKTHSNAEGKEKPKRQHFSPYVRLTISGKGLVASRMFDWWFNFAALQEVNFISYCAELEKCIKLT